MSRVPGPGEGKDTPTSGASRGSEPRPEAQHERAPGGSEGAAPSGSEGGADAAPREREEGSEGASPAVRGATKGESAGEANSLPASSESGGGGKDASGSGGAGPASSSPGGEGGEGPVEVAIVSIGALAMWRRLGWVLAVLAFLSLALWVAILVPIVSVPLLVSFIIAYLLAPLVDRLERWGMRRTLGIAVLILGFLGLMTGLVASIVPLVADDFRKMPDQLAQLFETASAWAESTFGYRVPQTGDAVMEAATEWFGELEDAQSLFGSVAQVVFGRTVSVLGMLLGFLMIPVFSFFFLRDFRAIFSQIRSLIPLRSREVIVQRTREIDSALGGFIRGQLIVAGILAVLYSIGLWLVGLPLAIIVGVISGLGNMIPYLGTAIGIILATLFALLDWQGILQLLLVYGVFAVVQLLEGWLITPNIVGNQVGLSPFGVIVAVLAFGELFGFLGVLLAVPIAAVLKILLQATIDAYRQSSLFERAPEA